MKLADIYLATQLNAGRERLGALRAGGRITGSIRCGSLTDDTLDPMMVELITPVIHAELDRRIALIDADLTAIGVEVPEALEGALRAS